MPEYGIVNGCKAFVQQINTHSVVITPLGSDVQHILPRITFDTSNKSRKFRRRQVPLGFAYAMSAHKSQGSTMQRALIDIRSDAFDHGQLYVSLSRTGQSKNVGVIVPSLPEPGTRLTVVNVVHQVVLKEGPLALAPTEMWVPTTNPRQEDLEEQAVEPPPVRRKRARRGSTSGALPPAPRPADDAPSTVEVRQRVFLAAQAHLGVRAATVEENSAAFRAAVKERKDATTRRQYKAILEDRGLFTEELLRAVLDTRKPTAPIHGALQFHTTAQLPSSKTCSWFFNSLAFAVLGYRGGDVDCLRLLMGDDFFGRTMALLQADFTARELTVDALHKQCTAPLYLKADFQESLLRRRETHFGRGCTLKREEIEELILFASRARTAASAHGHKTRNVRSSSG
jgi:hypothetical protein